MSVKTRRRVVSFGKTNSNSNLLFEAGISLWLILCKLYYMSDENVATSTAFLQPRAAEHSRDELVIWVLGH
jgi:hypothetical protein